MKKHIIDEFAEVRAERRAQYPGGEDEIWQRAV